MLNMLIAIHSSINIFGPYKLKPQTVYIVSCIFFILCILHSCLLCFVYFCNICFLFQNMNIISLLSIYFHSV